MKNNKKENGVTLIALVVTIIVLLILAGIAINYGTESVTKASDNKLESELNMMQHAILETYTKYQLQGKVVKQGLPGRKITNYEAVNILTERYTGKVRLNELDIDDYNNNNLNDDEYYYEFKESSQFKTIGVKLNKDTYIVNYKNGEVMNITTPEKTDGTLLYVSK